MTGLSNGAADGAGLDVDTEDAYGVTCNAIGPCLVFLRPSIVDSESV